MGGRDDDAGQSGLREAPAGARAQASKGWELRIATSLAELLRDRSRKDAARALLAPVYDWFDEGFGYPDMQWAAALLGELGHEVKAKARIGAGHLVRGGA